MRTIRASEIGLYLFCRRAWWCQQQGLPAQNQAELAGGTSYHNTHSRQVFLSGAWRAAAALLGLLALAALAVGLVQLLLK